MENLCAEVPNNNFVPQSPLTAADTQLDFGFLADLALKAVYADANCSTSRIAEKLCLPAPIAETLLQHLYKEKLVEIRGQVSYMNHKYAMLEKGWQRAHRLLDLNGYIGPAPVSLQSYTEMVSQQNQHREPVSPNTLKMHYPIFVTGRYLPRPQLVANSRRSLFHVRANPGTTKIHLSIAVSRIPARPEKSGFLRHLRWTIRSQSCLTT